MRQRMEDLDVVSTAFYGAIGVVLLLVVVLGVQAFFYAYQQKELDRKVVQPAFHELQELRAKQEAQLHGYRLLDPEAGVVAIPIEEAMKLSLKDLTSRRRAAEGKGGS